MGNFFCAPFARGSKGKFRHTEGVRFSSQLEATTSLTIVKPYGLSASALGDSFFDFRPIKVTELSDTFKCHTGERGNAFSPTVVLVGGISMTTAGDFC